ncbi:MULTISPECIES: TrkH family potassium uptake protein [unclassified Microbulbifer]|uniref:TrkH family potassium uptake protein n=1 Tax=unclassified Microbulbifer TaxID=2619833 RepID=UPI0027E599B4|nr:MULTISPECIES: TrkH family potassium uptake protein [unclassified Microbulbifer]
MRIWFPGLHTRMMRLGLQRAWRYSPPAILAMSFLVLIALGALLLWLPISSHGGLAFSEALFTACSAVTVTGLVVVDTGSALTLFGQVVVLVLIHMGGLGLMTFAALTVMALGVRFGLRGQHLVREAMNQTSPGDMLTLVRRVALLAFTLEALGTVLMAVVWVPEMGFWEGLWFSFFHSVSAFNNAGFGLRADSLSAWAGHPLINLVITALFIVGGLGFTVLTDLRRHRRFSTLSLHSKLTLSGTAILALGAWLLIMLFEWQNPHTLGSLPTGERPWAAWFTAVTPRTAGFNTVDTAGLIVPSTLLIILLMFIGAGSNSTASGIKVSTFMVILLATRSFLLGRPQPNAFRRTVALDVVFRANSVVVLSLMMVILGTFLLVVFEPRLQLLDLVFEGFSAFGTVGLSRGVTGELSLPGQMVLMVLMFTGRIGPLALAFSLARPRRRRVRYVEELVQVG